jgi:coenzyme F420-reducing hydrogenase gamma subunit
MQCQIDDIMDSFDFARARRMMEAVDWKWEIEGERRVPDEWELRKEARRQLKWVVESGGCIGSGGFMAMRQGDTLRLFFGLQGEGWEG